MKKRKTIKHKSQSVFLKIIKGTLLIFSITFLCVCLPIGLGEILLNLTAPLVLGLVFTAEIIALPFQIIYIICKLIEYSNQKQNSTYIATQGFQYYRNKLQDIHPMQISLLSNLKIEEEKDIKTMIMYYEHHNIIRVIGNQIEIIDDLNPLLKQSDRELLMRLTTPNQNNKLVYYEWKRKIQDEAISAGLVKKKGIGTAILRIFCTYFIAFLIMGLIAIISILFLANGLEPNVEINTIQDLLSNFKLVIGLTLMIILSMIDFALFFGGPVFIIVHFVSSSFLTRTAKGNEITEQIHGLKSFIHDFSTLEDATKQELIIWEDFLIYATILEENTQIVEEISGYKKL